MGLIDRIAEAVAELTVAGHSARSAERREFRRRLIEELRAYSTLIERVRIRLHEVAECLDETRPVIPPVLAPPLLAELNEQYGRFGPDPEVIERVDRVLQHARSSLRYRAATARPILLSALDEAIVEIRDLDTAWAQVRPRLDEALDFEAVAYLRAFRHDFRHLVATAVGAVEVLVDDDSPTAVDRARRHVDITLEAADHWNSHVVGTISQVRDDRPM